MHVFHVKVNGVIGRACNRQCGGGVQEKTYTVTREAGPGGESCDHATGDTASRGCNTEACVNPQENLLKTHKEAGMCSGSQDYKWYGNETGEVQVGGCG